MHEHRLGGLRGVVAAAPGVGVLRRGRGDEDGVRVSVDARGGPQLRQEGGHDALRRDDVRLVHPPPIREVSVLDALGAAGAPGDLHERVDGAGPRERLGEGRDIRLPREIGRERDRAAFLCEGREPVGAPCDGDDIPAPGTEGAGRGLADPGAGSRDDGATCLHPPTLPAARVT